LTKVCESGYKSPPFAALTAVAVGGRDFFVPDRIIKKKLDKR
jgi:hypothetical protein